MASTPLNFRRLGAAGLIGAALVLAGTVAYLAGDLPQSPDNSQRFEAGDFTFVMGSGAVDGKRILIDSFADGYALISSGPLNIEAGRYRFLRFAIDRDQDDGIPAFFWRRSQAPEDLAQRSLREEGPVLIDLSADARWNGEIAEFGFLLRGTDGGSVAIGPVWLEPDGLVLRLQQAWNRSIAFERWTQKSVNFLQGGAPEQPVRLPVVLIAWIAMTLALLACGQVFRTGSSRDFAVSGAILFLLAWMVLDLRWTANSMHQAELTIKNYWGASEQKRLSQGLDGATYDYISRLKTDVLHNQPARILIVGDERTTDYVLQRAKYHLLPHSALADRIDSSMIEPDALEYALFFSASAEPRDILDLTSQWEQKLRVVERSEWGVVCKVSANP